MADAGIVAKIWGFAMKIVAKANGKSESFWNGYWDRLDYAGNDATNADNIAEYVAGWNDACEKFPNADYRKLDENGR